MKGLEMASRSVGILQRHLSLPTGPRPKGMLPSCLL